MPGGKQTVIWTKEIYYLLTVPLDEFSDSFFIVIHAHRKHCCHDNYRTQTAMRMNPALWRKWIKPRIAYFVELCHSRGFVEALVT
jgi:hypothetical protein